MLFLPVLPKQHASNKSPDQVFLLYTISNSTLSVQIFTAIAESLEEDSASTYAGHSTSVSLQEPLLWQ